MTIKKDTSPFRINLSEERKGIILRALKDFCGETFDEDLSDYRAEQILRFFLKALGPSVYNQAIQDARGFMLDKLDDLDATFYERESLDSVRNAPDSRNKDED